MDSLEALTAPQPALSMAAAARILADEFGLSGALHPLRGERDQNFRLITDNDGEFVFKVANPVESDSAVDFQIRALLHIEQQDCPVAVPRIRRTRGGDETCIAYDADTRYRCRVVSYLHGNPLSGVGLSPDLLADFGRSAAALDRALSTYTHAADSPVLPWDLQRAGSLRGLLQYVDDRELRAAITTCLDDFERNVEPALPSLRSQVIHNDLNADNVLAQADNARAITGFIDFGDMLRAPLIAEIAIAAAYLRSDEANCLEYVVPFVRAYDDVLPLQHSELELLFDLVRARLAATISITHWRVADRGADDAYARHCLASERNAEQFLHRLDATGRQAFLRELRLNRL